MIATEAMQCVQYNFDAVYKVLHGILTSRDFYPHAGLQSTLAPTIIITWKPHQHSAIHLNEPTLAFYCVVAG